MGFCRGRNILLILLVLQLLLVLERQVFDFLGFMWAPIIANFIHIAFLIVGIFGVHQYRTPYIITYSVWCLLWFGINLFIISLYLEIDRVTHTDDWLSLKTDHQSFWAKNGIGCKPVTTIDTSTVDGTKTSTIEGCLLHFTYVESIQSGAECILAFAGFWLGCWVARSFMEEDDHFDFIGGFDSNSAHHPPSKSSRLQMQPISS
ncbi:sodium/potassium-transporting ATPase subunit beta-1-interacting protein 1-like isoform X1 [Montipora foliosa]|uniref:sodium/potassium-transporting ATPase subunit beta-1-interacting protein 1-like isoform X1 n=1 Tax=Montipora foliosa TaxID=591990 RepID=UPI0035F1B744